jgi:hypothetical protein
MNNIFWDVMPCGSCKNRRFEERSSSIIGVTRIREQGTTLAATFLRNVGSYKSQTAYHPRKRHSSMQKQYTYHYLQRTSGDGNSNAYVYTKSLVCASNTETLG